jgi:transposase
MENTVESSISIEKLQIENETLKQEKAELELKLKWFEEQFRLQQHKLFGSSSEKTEIPEQLSLFNEVESESKLEAPEPTFEEISYKRKKKVGHREEMFKDLPVEIIEYHISEEEQICDICGEKTHEMSKVISRKLKIVPVQVSVVELVQFVYACRKCDKDDIVTHIKTAPMPKPAIPGSIASSSAIAYVMTEKFVKGMPLYRQEQEWKRMGVEISRQTMANWMTQGSERWLKPLCDRMHEHLISKDILHADETTLQVLKEPGRPAESKSYMWLYRTGREGPPIIIYEYQTTRANKHPERFLKGFKGFLNTDAYSGYNGLPGIINVACWAHARRKFDEALKAMPKNQNDAPSAAQEGQDFCNQLFAIERDLHDVTTKERYEGRLEKSRPVIDSFRDWLKYQKPRVLPKSSLGAAIQYCLNQWDKLNAFLLDGRLELDNNRAERSIKPFVIGRKNWLFSNTPKGATSSAIIYSIVETAKENGLNPFEYLKFIFDKMPNMDISDMSDLDKLLPWSDELPDECKIKK